MIDILIIFSLYIEGEKHTATGSGCFPESSYASCSSFLQIGSFIVTRSDRYLALDART